MEEELSTEAKMESEGMRWGFLTFMAASASQISPSTDKLPYKTSMKQLIYLSTYEPYGQEYQL